MTRTTFGLGAGALALFMSAAPMALAQTTPPPDQTIIVTATRVATNVQKTPVQVTPFSGQQLHNEAVNNLNDVTYLAPSVRYASSAAADDTTITMRGISDGFSLSGTGNEHAAQAYFEDVPFIGNLPVYDLDNIQVLQGPQGTLFGRNTIGGAVLVNPVLPTYTPGGYLKASFGNYNAWEIEGGINATIVPDVLAVRVSGQIWKRDGFDKDVTQAPPCTVTCPLGPTAAQIVNNTNPIVSNSSLPELANVNETSFRASILFTPTAHFKDVVTFDYFNAPEESTPAVLVEPSHYDNVNGYTNCVIGSQCGPAQTTLVPLNPPSMSMAMVNYLNNCNHLCVNYAPGVTSSTIFSARSHYFLANTATWTVSPELTLKDVFGYQTVENSLGEDSNGQPSLSFIAQLYTPASTTLSNDFQAQFNLFDTRLHGLAGFYYEADGAGGNTGDVFPIPGFGNLAATTGANATVYATYINATFDITSKLKFNAGFRYTWYNNSTCTGTTSLASTPGTLAQCFANSASHTSAFPGVLPPPTVTPYSAAEPSWTVGLSYQATPDLYLYVTASQSTRPGGADDSSIVDPCFTGDAGFTGVPGSPGSDLFTAGGAGSAAGLGEPFTPISAITNFPFPPDPHACVDLGTALANPQDPNASAPGHSGQPSGTTLNVTQFATTAPQTITDIELGLRSDWHLLGWRERFNLTYYHYTLTNITALMQLDTTDPVDYNLTTVNGDADLETGSVGINAGNVEANGIDADLSVIPTKDLMVDFNLSWLGQKATQQNIPSTFDGLNPAQLQIIKTYVLPQVVSPTPPVAFTITARYVLPWHPLRGDLVLSYDYFWTAGWDMQQIGIPGYDLHNARLDWNNIGGSGVSLGIWVRNMLDDRYIEACTNCRAGVDLYGEPRMFGMDLSAKF